MPTNFFQRQANARRSTGWLLFMFGLATIAVVASIMGVVAIVIAVPAANNSGSALTTNAMPWEIPVFAGVGALALILGGSFFKVLQLRAGGGAMVAESLGGVRIYPNTADPVERRLLNVVEEMAIASGTSVPPVFMLGQEMGINAFAAGYSPEDAVLGITRGCAEKLKREELQGVVAHEFSHILNGDMRLGIRVMGVLFGILLLGLVGQLVFRMVAFSGRGSSRRNSDSGKAYLAMLLIAVALIVLGFVGTFIGNLIKAAISRQREHLADASGVQFTRNPFGLAGALKRIGGEEMGSQLVAPNAAEASHMFFAEGVWKSMAGLWSSHPPLADRIRELDPGWDGKYPAPGAATREIAQELRTPATHSSLVGNSQSNMNVKIVDRAIEHVGNPTTAHVNYAESLRPLIPDFIITAAREPYAARAIVLCLLLNRESGIRATQLDSIRKIMAADATAVVEKLLPFMDQLDVRVRLPLVDIAIPALAAMSRKQFDTFIRAFETLALADGQLDLFEWVLAQVVTRHLRPHFLPAPAKPIRYRPIAKLANECAIVLSAVAYGGNSDVVARQAFETAANHFPGMGLSLLPRGESTLSHLRQALANLAKAAPSDLGQLVDACADSITADGRANLEEVEMLRGISDLLGCPMPPLLAE